jgi:hypothetical protein
MMNCFPTDFSADPICYTSVSALSNSNSMVLTIISTLMLRLTGSMKTSLRTTS